MYPVSALKAQLAEARLKRSNSHIDAVYTKYAKHLGGISQSDFLAACREVRSDLDFLDGWDEFFHSMDMNSDGLLDLDEFRHIVDKSSALELFISQAVPFHQLFSAVLHQKPGKDPLDVFRELSPTEVHDIVQAVSEELENVLNEKVAFLRESAQAALAQASISNTAKFTVEDLKAGTIEDYRKGLSGRVGEHSIDCLQYKNELHLSSNLHRFL